MTHADRHPLPSFVSSRRTQELSSITPKGKKDLNRKISSNIKIYVCIYCGSTISASANIITI